MTTHFLRRITGALALMLVGCSEPTGLPKSIATPGTFALAGDEAMWEGSATLITREFDGEIITLADASTVYRMEIAVGPAFSAPTLSVMPTTDIPADYVRWIRVYHDGVAGSERFYIPIESKLRGERGMAGTRMQFDIRLSLRTNELGAHAPFSAITLSGDAPPELRVRGALWAVAPTM